MEGLGMGEAMGETSPAAVPSASRRESRNTHQWARKKILSPQAGIYSWAVISSLPPSILPSSPISTLLTPNPDLLEALSSPAVGRVAQSILRCSLGF